MPQYQYQAYNSQGRSVKGVVTTDSAAAAKSQLRNQGLFPSELREVEVQSKAGGDSGKKIFRSFFNRISTDDLAGMTRQLATLVASHIPLVEALDALTEQVENDRLKAACSRVKADVNEGAPLHRALSRYPDVFSGLYISMVESGEASGALDVVLLRLADFLEYQSRLQKKVTSAMIYPAIMLLVGLGAVLFIFTVVIPQFETIFEDNRQTLPTITQVILFLSRNTIEYWWVLFIAIATFVYTARRFLKTDSGKRWWDQKKLKLPVVGDLVRMVAISRFTKTLSTLLRSGITLLACLKVVKNVVGNITIKEAIEEATTNLTEGQGISGPLKRSGQFPPMVTHMISVGERTGELEDMLQRVAEHYDYQVDTRIQGFTSLIEPLMILLLAGVVLIIVLSVVLPMIEMTNIAI